MKYLFMSNVLKFIFLILTFQCQNSNSQNGNEEITRQLLLHPNGLTINTRFSLPDNYKRTNPTPNSFAFYLSHLPMEEANAKVLLYNKQEKAYQEFCAGVIKMDIGTQNLQQCADAVIRLRAEYLFNHKKYNQIHFNLTNGFRTNFLDWANGNRIKVSGNKCVLEMAKAKPDFSYKNFRKYLDFVFSYAGSLSLSKELQPVDLQNIEIGDVFIKGGSPGHAVIVVDMAVENESNNKIFLLAQSYMPAQSVHVVVNPNNESISPWYSLKEIDSKLDTYEWIFSKNELMRFKEE